jgi:SAM-dependent methyltransferase
MTTATPHSETRAADRTAPCRDPGSFRDPHGFVIHAGARIFRALGAEAHRSYGEAQASGVLDALLGDGLLVDTWPLAEDEAIAAQLHAQFPEAHAFVEQRAIPLPTYPAEWTFSMIADAGILTLDIQARCIRSGFTLQDASAYNVFFDGVKPSFVDMTSIQRARRLDIWRALGQFHRLFLYPLLLAHHRNIPSKGYYLAHLDGLFARDVSRIIGPSRFLRPSLLLDVTLPAALIRFGRGERGSAAFPAAGEAPRGNPEVQCMMLRRLRRKLLRLRRRHRPRSLWTAYERDNSYAAEAETVKGDYIRAFMERYRPTSVTDVGCNTGRYSRIAARAGARVVAVDADHDSLDELYRSLTGTGGERLSIQPVWTSFDNPTPAIGFANGERASFLSRHRAQAVFALALVHHLLVTARIALPMLVRQFAELTGEWLVLEYVSPEDRMFRSLGAFRESLYLDLTEARFLEAFGERFSLVDLRRLPGGTRVLLTMRKR